MNEYEILLMLDADLPEERGNEIIARMREQVEGDGGTLGRPRAVGAPEARLRDRPQGRGRLPPAALQVRRRRRSREIARVLKITDGVMRHLAVKRVKGGQTKAPAPISAVSAPADDAGAAAE